MAPMYRDASDALRNEYWLHVMREERMIAEFGEAAVRRMIEERDRYAAAHPGTIGRPAQPEPELEESRGADE